MLLNDVFDVFFGGSYCLVTLRFKMSLHCLFLYDKPHSEKDDLGYTILPTGPDFSIYVNLSAHSS